MIRTANFLIYDDAYNASPESMAAAFESVRLIGKDRRKIAAVGGILELWSYSSEQHFKVGQAAANSEMDLLFVCGENREDVKAGALSIRPDLPVYLFAFGVIPPAVGNVDFVYAALQPGQLGGDFRLHAEAVMAMLLDLGVEPDRLSLTSAMSDAAAVDEVHLYIR
jgi:hypothetical protein